MLKLDVFSRAELNNVKIIAEMAGSLPELIAAVDVALAAPYPQPSHKTVARGGALVECLHPVMQDKSLEGLHIKRCGCGYSEVVV